MNTNVVHNIFIVMEYIESDLFELVSSKEIEEFEEQHLITLLYNIMSALKRLHKANILHRDLKPANILV